MKNNRRIISIGRLRTTPLAYLSGFFGHVVSRDEMATLREFADEIGAKYVDSGAWDAVIRFEALVDKEPKACDTFARDTVDMTADRMLSGIRWRYGRQCKLFMEGYLDGLPAHLSMFDALEMMKQVAPSYFKGSAE